MPVWERGVETGEVLSPVHQTLVLTALGGSIGTPDGGLEGEIVRFRSLEELALSGGSARGKIAFIDRPTARTSDGSGYGSAGDVRGRGPSAAARQGAIGLLIRSIGTDDDRATSHRRHALRGRRSEDPGGGARGAGRVAADAAPRARARQSEVHARLPDSSGWGIRQRDRRDPGTRASEGDRAARRAPRLVGPGHGRARRRRRMRHRDRGRAADRAAPEAPAAHGSRRPLRERGARPEGRQDLRGGARGGASRSRRGPRGRPGPGTASRFFVERRSIGQGHARGDRSSARSDRRRRCSWSWTSAERI